MKKTLATALTTALVVGAASTTFAASNPFSDVPADHWAYDAVTQLAADGVIEGYGDTTFQGQKNITRYEMAQMIAKAMAKNPQGTDKALIDKLAAEFADELNNLGVRVAKLERNADMVKWNGTAEYTFDHKNYDSVTNDHENNTNDVLFRLEPSAEVNSNWHVNARLDVKTNLKNDTANKNDDTNVKLKRVWAQGDYDKFSVKAGKFAPLDDDSIFDTEFSGAEFAANLGEAVKLTVGAGRLSHDDLKDTANHQYYGLDYEKSKLKFGASFHHADSVDFANFNYKKNGTTDNANIWLVKGAYTFGSSVGLNGFYAENHDADAYEKAASAELTYKGAEQENKGTWGMWAAYRHLGQNVDFFNTFDVVNAGEKAWEVGANYTPFKNTVAQVRFANGKKLSDSSDKFKTIFGRVNFYF